MTLTDLVTDLNTACGYSGRYTLIRRSAPPHSGWAIMKKEGALDRNVSGWGTPLQLRFWVLGHLEGYDACLRRSDKADKAPTALRQLQGPPWPDFEAVQERFETPGS